MRLLLVSHTYVVPANRTKPAALAAQGIDVRVLIPNRWSDPLFDLAAATREEEAPYQLMVAPVLLAGHGRAYCFPPRRLARLLAALQPDIVHVEEELDSVVMALFGLLRSRFGYRLTCFAWENLPRTSWLAPLARFTAGRCDGALGGSRGAAGLLRRRGVRGPIAVLPQLGVDIESPVSSLQSPVSGGRSPDRRPETRDPRPETRDRRFVVGYVGRLAREKGVHVLLEAVAHQGDDSRLLFVGRGPEEVALRRQAEVFGAGPRVSFAGAVPHGEVPRLLAKMDVLVLPSVGSKQWQEQFGHVLIEAMAAGVPVIGSSSGAIPEVVGDAGLLVPPNEVGPLAEAIQRLAGDGDLRDELTARGLERVRAHFTHARVAEQTAAFLRQVLRQGRPSTSSGQAPSTRSG
ncbi:MAG: glycosyltransferase family 4 protein [Chloroflexi bacterium]|nr:glycosyltransferase family 4 protein [Chloroflexota bacterium]